MLLAPSRLLLAGSSGGTEGSLAEEKARAMLEVQWTEKNVLPPCSVSDVFRFNIEDGLLKVDWPIIDNGCTGGLLALTDMPGKARLQVYQGRDRVGGQIFEVYDFSDPALVERHLQVLGNDLQLQVVEDEEAQRENSLRTISLIEKLQGSDPDVVTLRVQKLDDPPMNQAIFASSLDDLRQKYPREYELYLRPMFRALRQEQQVFAVNSRTAWQVVSDEWTPTPELKAKVEAILVKLNSENFSERDAAQKELRQVGEPAALYLNRRDREGLSAEQKARIDSFLLDYSPLSADEVAKLGRNENFLLDCLLDDDAALRAAALKRLEQNLGHTIKIDLQASPEVRSRQIAAIRSGILPTTDPSQ
jgi:hypothetical protein